MEHSNDFAGTWIADHVASGERSNKPMILEEYGLGLSGTRDVGDSVKSLEH
jgi:hypothetical protein